MDGDALGLIQRRIDSADRERGSPVAGIRGRKDGDGTTAVVGDVDGWRGGGRWRAAAIRRARDEKRNKQNERCTHDASWRCPHYPQCARLLRRSASDIMT